MALDREALRRDFDLPHPFRFLAVDGLLDEAFARAVSDALPGLADARRQGMAFDRLNERGKVQVSDAKRFPEPVRRLSEALASPEFLATLTQITGIPNLVADPLLAGGGIHVTGPSGRLDVHVDFNYDATRRLHRRLNLLLYLNPGWQPAWGGQLELWDADVRHCWRSIEPAHNRCVLFETSEISFHGVRPVRCPPGVVRKSFAAYYYTREAPPGWQGRSHSTVFRARPDERFRRYVAMPSERLWRRVVAELRAARRRIGGHGRPQA